MGHPGSNKVRGFDCQDIQATIATEVFATKISSESRKFAKNAELI